MIQICVSLSEATVSATTERMGELAGVADLFEIRGDLIQDLDLLAILRAKTEPLVFSCRPESEGGAVPDGEKNRRSRTLLEAIKRGFDYVDIEHRSGWRELMKEKAGRGLIVSLHDLVGMPDDLEGLYDAMCDDGADIVKLAITPRSFADVVRILEFAGEVAERGGAPLIPIALGPEGIVTRVIAGRYGAPFTYASSSRGSETAVGQLPAEDMAYLYRVREIEEATEIYGVIGSDVGQSLSPQIHNTALQVIGRDAVLVPLETRDLGSLVAGGRRLGIAGYAVTKPYKEDILAFLDEVDESGTRCRSVNTVVVRDGKLIGRSTDGPGVLAALKPHTDVAGKTVMILGAGGAARAAALALQEAGADVTMFARDSGKAREAADLVGVAGAALSELADRSWDVLINATPVGAGSTVGESLVPMARHQPASVVLDMVYEPRKTQMLADAEGHACTVIEGMEMLLGQAAPQFEVWTGETAPIEEMRDAVAVPVPEAG